MWFAGVHADIGGGYPEKESGLSKYPLLWMIDEATKCGLKFTTANVNQLAWGIQRKGSPYSYVAPDVRGDLHTSLRGAWWLLEYLPKSAKYKEWPARQAHFGYYIPDAEPRLIPEGAIIHESARAAHGCDAELSAGEYAGEVRDVSDAVAAGAWRERGAMRRRMKRKDDVSPPPSFRGAPTWREPGYPLARRIHMPWLSMRFAGSVLRSRPRE